MSVATLNTRQSLSLEGAKLGPLLCTVGIGLAVWLIPLPSDLTPEAWRLFAIFVATITGIILRPLPVGAVVTLTLVTILLTQTLSLATVLQGYSNPSIWLIVVAFFLAKALIKTGFAMRCAYWFIRRFGRNTLLLALGILASELLLAPLIPSSAARSGGIIYPIAVSIIDNLQRDNPQKELKTTKQFLILAVFQGAVISSAMFMTAMAANPIAVEIAAANGIEISWSSWALAACLPGFLSILAVVGGLYWFFNPELKATPRAQKLAAERLQQLGPMKVSEFIILVTFTLVLTLWILGAQLHISSTLAALIGLSILLISGVITWQECLEEKTAWDTFFWLSLLVTIGLNLKTMGLFSWLSASIVTYVQFFSWPIGLSLIGLSYFYAHYFFASNTAHLTAMFSAFLVAALQIGAPPMLAALSLAFASSLFGGLTHYSCAPAVIYFKAGYVTLQTWWVAGALCSLINISIWLGVGIPWWYFLGIIT